MLCSLCVIGIINKDYHPYSVFNKILLTFCQLYSQDEYNTVVKSFNHFLNITDQEGHIQHFDLCGVRIDKDINGNDVIRLANISQESYQHSKCLTHLHQLNLCLETIQTIKSKEIKKKTTANVKHKELAEENEKAVELICKKFYEKVLLAKMLVFVKTT
jgi:hypothetical protein